MYRAAVCLRYQGHYSWKKAIQEKNSGVTKDTALTVKDGYTVQVNYKDHVYSISSATEQKINGNIHAIFRRNAFIESAGPCRLPASPFTRVEADDKSLCKDISVQSNRCNAPFGNPGSQIADAPADRTRQNDFKTGFLHRITGYFSASGQVTMQAEKRSVIVSVDKKSKYAVIFPTSRKNSPDTSCFFW